MAIGTVASRVTGFLRLQGDPHAIMVAVQSSRSRGGKSYSTEAIDWGGVSRDVRARRSKNLLVEKRVVDGTGHPLRLAWGGFELSIALPGARLSRNLATTPEITLSCSWPFLTMLGADRILSFVRWFDQPRLRRTLLFLRAHATTSSLANSRGGRAYR
jgi:hypothetical protein